VADSFVVVRILLELLPLDACIASCQDLAAGVKAAESSIVKAWAATVGS
jgi:hypothetical protein